VLALVDPALGGRVEGVHDFRVAARSLRAALRTLTRRPLASRARRTRRYLHRAIRSLAAVRDRDVGRSSIARLATRSAFDPALKRRILGLSDSDRRVALIRSETRWPKLLDRELMTLLETGEASVETVIRRARAEAWRQRRRALVLLRRLGRRYSPGLLHDLRRRIRSLRYAIEVLAEVDGGASARAMQLRPLQGALGDTQDHIVMSRWLQAEAKRFRGAEPALSGALRTLAVRFRAQSIRAHRSFLKLKPMLRLEGLALHVDPRG
jgi:CHAD domain-containing protein